MLRLDHVILAVPDLDAAAERLLAEHGLDSRPGGRHAGLGTGNRIVPLGDEYVELMAVVDADEARGNPLGTWLLALAAGGEVLAGLCLATDDISAVAARLGLSPLPMSRVKDDGTTVSWRLAGLETALGEERLPFFIEWGEGSPHPGADAVSHRSNPTGISWVEIGADPERMAEWLDGAYLAIRCVPGEPGVRRAGIAAAGGEIVLG